MNQIDEILSKINLIDDLDALGRITTFVAKKVEEIQSRPKGTLTLVENNGHWYAILNGNKARGVKLGPRLSPAAVLRQARQKPPVYDSFELSKSDAESLMRINPEEVGWWEEGPHNARRFYHVQPYLKAKSEYIKQQKLAKDELTLTYGLSLEAVMRLKELEANGYELVLPLE